MGDIKWKAVTFTRWDRIKLIFKKLHVREFDGQRIEYKITKDGRLYVYRIYKVGAKP